MVGIANPVLKLQAIYPLGHLQPSSDISVIKGRILKLSTGQIVELGEH